MQTMASEQPELLFFDTFSHETSEKHQEVDGLRIGLPKNMKQKVIQPEWKLVNKTMEEATCSCASKPLGTNEKISSPPEFKNIRPIYHDKQVDNIFSIDGSGTSDFDFDNNTIEIAKSCGFKSDLWIPSNKTKHTLYMKMIHDNYPNGELLTCPELCEEEITSRFDQLVATVNDVGTTNCGAFLVQNVSQDEYGLRDLVQKEAFSAAVNLTAKLLTVRRQCGKRNKNEPIHHTPESLQLWFTRLALLVKMQEFDLAELEASYWQDCDKPDLYYEFYPDIYEGRSGSMVPFQMRLLIANLPSFCGRHSESLDKLFSILATVRKILKSLGNKTSSRSQLDSTDVTGAKQLWGGREKRVLISIVNVAMKMEDFILAVDIVTGLIKDESTIAKKQTLYSILGRIHLQFGDISSAEKYFSMARSDLIGTSDPNKEFLNIVDFGLLAVAQNDFPQAYQYFEKASFIDPSSLTVMNNCAVCLFYLGHLGESIRLLSGAVNNDPLHALQDSLILNLCTMQELSTARCRDISIQLLKFTKLFKGDSINVASFRLL